jgi:excisionase family DNA binding protein
MTKPDTGTIDAQRPNRRPRRHPDLPPAVLDRPGAANYLGLGLTTLAELTGTGAVPSFRVGRRRLYRLADLDAWLAARVGGGSGAA